MDATDPTAARIARLKTKPWNEKDFSVPEEVFAVPGMLWTQEKRMLYYLTVNDYSGEGAIADMGAFLGGSTICFAAGLRQRSWTRSSIHSYDLFRLGPFEREQYFPENPPEDLRTRQIFDTHLQNYRDLVIVHEGDVLGFAAPEPIELIFVDIAKSYKVFDHLLTSFLPALIPGRALVILQDYLSGSTGPWHHIVMEKLSEYCEYVVDADRGSAVFLVKQAIPYQILSQCQWMEITMEEKLHLMDRAIEKLDTVEKKRFLMENRELLLQGKDRYWGMHYHSL
jgi:predicted O-methyltransferase YrrM